MPRPKVLTDCRTRALVRHGYLDAEERFRVNEIYDYNPLLFDFVLKRTMKLPGTTRRMPAAVFMSNGAIGV